MFCPNCGNHILDANASFCPNCGAKLNSFTQGIDQSSAQQDFQQDSQQNSQQDFQQDSQQDFQQDSQQDSQQNSQQNSQQDSQQNSQQSGYHQGIYTPPQQDCTPCAPAAAYNVLSIAGFSLSCAAIISNILLFGLPGIVGLILSIVGLCQCNKRSEKGRGLAIAGIVIGAVLTLLMIFVYAGLILAFDNGWNSGPRYY